MCSFPGSAGLTWCGLRAISQWPSLAMLFQDRVAVGVRGRVVGDHPRESQSFLPCTLLFARRFWSRSISHLAHWSSFWYLCSHLPSYLPFLLLWLFQWFPSVLTFKVKPLHLIEVTVSLNLQLLRPWLFSIQYCSVGGVIDILGGTVHCARLSRAFQ